MAGAFTVYTCKVYAVLVFEGCIANCARVLLTVALSDACTTQLMHRDRCVDVLTLVQVSSTRST